MQIAFYGSTPAYRPVLDLHGWGDLQTELNRLSKAGEWAAHGRADRRRDARRRSPSSPTRRRSPPRLAERYGDVVTRISLRTLGTDPDRWSAVIAAISV